MTQIRITSSGQPYEMAERDPRTYAIIGAAMEAHSDLGCGFREAVYQEALREEFDRAGIPYQKEVGLAIRYKDRKLPVSYRVDFVCYDSVLVELKALSGLSGSEVAQILNYLKASDLKTGFLLNFGKPGLEYRRFML